MSGSQLCSFLRLMVIARLYQKKNYSLLLIVCCSFLNTVLRNGRNGPEMMISAQQQHDASTIDYTHVLKIKGEYRRLRADDVSFEIVFGHVIIILLLRSPLSLLSRIVNTST